MNRLLGGGFEAGLDAEDAENAKKGKSYDYAWMAQNRANRNAAWEHYSLDTVERAQKAEAEIKAADYKPVHPWTKTSVDHLHEKHLANLAKDYQYSKPWDCPANEVNRETEADLNKQMEAIAGTAAYSTTCPWKPEEMTEKQKKVIADYKYTTPYYTKFSKPGPAEKSAKRRVPGKDPYATTVKPWEIGKQPLPPKGKEAHPQPSTTLWDAPISDPLAPAAVAMESSGDPVLDNLRMQLKKKGASGILGLSRKFKIMDDDNSGTLNLDEFTKAMRECEAADLSKQAINHLFRYFDKDDSGSITYDEFLVGIRGVLTQRRRALVALAFDVLDKDKSGEVTLDDIREAYDATGHPDVLRGARTLEDVLVEFLGSFEKGGTVDGVVTYDEFENYYSNVSASIDLDDYFELMIRNAWHISGGEGWCANTTNKRVLVTHADGTQTVEEIKDDLGLKANDKKGMMERLLKQGVSTMVGVNTAGATDGTKGKGGDGSQHLEELQKRAAGMGLVPGMGSSSNSSNGRHSANNNEHLHAAPLKPQSLAAALSHNPPPHPESSSRLPSSASSLSSRQPAVRPGPGPPPMVVRPAPTPAFSSSVNGSVVSGGSQTVNGHSHRPKSLSAHLNY